ncbi:MAG: 30S ribosome-binding factor RbfA [Gammaproteobacteria bacterium]|jgi:ribosome-binding factor A|nr:30S ribosome-binding factor RbfA [Gammaproteobacteria bacterium]
MPREFHRSQRIAEEIQRSVSEIVRLRLKDPRLEKITITEVKVSRDLSHARIFYSSFDLNADRAVLTEALASSAGKIRQLLSREMRLRRVPELHFEYDQTLEQALRVTSLIDEAVASDRAAADDSSDS